MRWLRHQRDLIALIAVWGLALQSLMIPFTAGLHAAERASGNLEAVIWCATPGASRSDESQSNGGSHGPCWNAACHFACSGTSSAGILPTFARVILPGKTDHAAALSRESKSLLALHAEAQPRAPPFA